MISSSLSVNVFEGCLGIYFSVNQRINTLARTVTYKYVDVNGKFSMPTAPRGQRLGGLWRESGYRIEFKCAELQVRRQIDLRREGGQSVGIEIQILQIAQQTDLRRERGQFV